MNAQVNDGINFSTTTPRPNMFPISAFMPYGPPETIHHGNTAIHRAQLLGGMISEYRDAA